MSRPTVRKQLERPGGGPAAGARGFLRLVASVAGDEWGYAAAADVDVAGVQQATADSTGLLSFANVRPNSGVSADAITSPTGTVYELVVVFRDRRQLVEYVAVPDSAGPLWVQDCRTVPPSSLPVPGAVSTSQFNALLGAASGLATLDSGGHVPAGQLPNLSGTYLTVAQKAAASGVASLDSGTKVPAGQIPDLSATYIVAAQKAAASGVAPLDASSHVPRTHRPDLDRYNVKDYGAVGDGVVDDTAAINSVLALLACSTDYTAGANQSVFFPEGTYRVTSTLVTGNSLSHVTFHGEGAHSSVIAWDGGNAEMFKFVNAAHVVMRDLGFKGNANASKRPTYGIRIHRGAGIVGTTSPTAFKMQNCFLGSTSSNSMTTAVGFTCDSGLDANNDIGTFENVDITNVATGYWFSHANTLWHTIWGGFVSFCSVACIDNTPDTGLTYGGSYATYGTRFRTTNTSGAIFRVGPSVGGDTLDIYGMNAESSFKLIDTPASITTSSGGMRFFGGHASIRDQADGFAAIDWDTTETDIEFHGYTLTSPAGARIRFPTNGGKVLFNGGRLVMKEFVYNCEVAVVGTRVTGGGILYTNLGSGAFYQYGSDAGQATASTFSPLGLTGATQATRLVGATTSGSPSTGSFAVGDTVLARDGFLWVCTTAGSPGTWARVGLRSPSSQTTAPLGASALTNGDFAASLASWTGANWAFSAGTALHTTGSTAALTQALSGLTSGGYYLISWTITGRTAGTVSFALDAASVTGKSVTGTDTVISPSATPTFTVTPTTDFDGAVDNLSVQLIGTSTPQAYYDTALGTSAAELRASTGQVALGLNALGQNVTGSTNTAFGTNALRRNVTGTANTAVGSAANTSNTSGSGNVSAGSNALTTCTAGQGNTALGTNALTATTTGNFATAVGNAALASITTATGTAVGELALGSVTGANNTAVGRRAGWSPAGVTANASTTAVRQTLIGNMTGQASTTQRDDVVCVGDSALVDGNGAVAIGSGASAGAAGAVAIGRSSAGVAAATTTADEIKVGTATHTYNFPGSAWLIADGANYTLGTTTGTKFGTAANQKWATHGATPTVQRAGAAQAAVDTTPATATTPYGFATQAQADAIVTLLNEIRAALVEKGIIKGSA